MRSKPNVVLIMSDQERARSWIPDELQARLPGRGRLMNEGMELRNHYTHSSPCSPSRATLLTGQYVPEHGVTDNVFVDPAQPDLHTATRTIGHMLRDAGYYTGYVGKWHLSYGNPDMERYGFSDWSGEDWAWTGLAGTGTYYDEIITTNAEGWLREHGTSTEPWLLVIGLVNPHDICWYPADQPDYQAANRERTEAYASMIGEAVPGRGSIPTFEGEYEELFDLPANFDDDLNAKPAVHKQWRWEDNHTMFGFLEPDDERRWRRALDYYFHLHTLSDEHISRILDALDATGNADDTAVIFTSDHGEQAGSHGLRGKGPFAYEEIMHVPCYVRAPGIAAPGSSTESLTSSADIPSLITSLAGVDGATTSTMSGTDLTPLLVGEAESVRDHVLFAQEQAWHMSCVGLRFALRGCFDGRYKYVRYYGVGGGVDSMGRTIPWQKGMRFGPDADFVDLEHELYDLQEDPGELVNLAVDRAHPSDARERFDALLDLERGAYTHTRPEGVGDGSTHSAGMMEHSAYFEK
ncbi:MAG: sulfatase-like hydrolase/transferase [Acidimicrobiia bacterium]